MRVVMMIVGSLAIGLGFIFSYVGAFHDPQPHGIKVAVVAPADDASAFATRLSGLPGGPLRAVPLQRVSAARRQVLHDDVAAALIANPRGQQDRLLVASGAGAALTSTVEQTMIDFEASRHRSFSTTDLVPLQRGDFHGASGFYMVVGWLIAGYILAAVLGMLSGGRAATLRDVGSRLLLLVPYSIAAGVGGVLIVDTLLGAQTGHFFALAGLGALLVLAAGAVSIALQAAMGIIGIGVAVLLFVIIGNPSSGGPYQSQLLPGFWRTIGNALPNGSGVEALRRIVYFGSSGVTRYLLIISAYIVGGTIAAVAVTAYRSRSTRTDAGAVRPMPRIRAHAA